MDDFTLQMPFAGDTAKALDMLAASLSSEGFRITSRSAYEVGFKGPPQPRNYGEMSRFWGASAVKVSAKGNALYLTAEMGEMKRAGTIAKWIFGGMLAAALSGLVAMFYMGSGTSDAVIIMLALTVPIVVFVAVLTRLMVSSQEQRTKAAYETLLNNAVMLGRAV